MTISDFLEFLGHKREQNQDIQEWECTEEIGLKLIGNILKAELRTLRNIWDWAGDISKEKDFINSNQE